MTPDELREFRLAHRLTQEELALVLGVQGHRTVRKWEGGERAIPEPVAILLDLAEIPAVRRRLGLRRPRAPE